MFEMPMFDARSTAIRACAQDPSHNLDFGLPVPSRLIENVVLVLDSDRSRKMDVVCVRSVTDLGRENFELRHPHRSGRKGADLLPEKHNQGGK